MLLLATNIFAQSESFLVSTASKFKKWEFVKTEFDKYKFGQAVLKKIEKKFGVATSITIEADGNFFWNISNADSSITTNGKITEIDDDSYFEFLNADKLKVSASFKNYDSEMCLTIYGREKDEFVNLIYKKQ
jgi:hypothetical protein